MTDTTQAELRGWLERDNATTEQAAESAIAVYKEAKARSKTAAAPWDVLADEAKALLTDIIIETGITSFKTSAGMAYIPAPGGTVAYDAKALDALCASNDEVRRLLWPHRSEKERPGSLTIR